MEQLFFDGCADLVQWHTSPVRDRAALQSIVHGKNVYILGESKRVLDGLKESVGIMTKCAFAVRHLSFSALCDDPAPLSKFLTRACRAPFENIILLAEERYGDAFSKLCQLVPAPLPVLLPDGLLTTAMPGCWWHSAEPGCAVTRHHHAQMLELLPLCGVKAV
jgi:hypothetical protein